MFLCPCISYNCWIESPKFWIDRADVTHSILCSSLRYICITFYLSVRIAANDKYCLNSVPSLRVAKQWYSNFVIPSFTIWNMSIKFKFPSLNLWYPRGSLFRKWKINARLLWVFEIVTPWYLLWIGSRTTPRPPPRLTLVNTKIQDAQVHCINWHSTDIQPMHTPFLIL